MEKYYYSTQPFLAWCLNHYFYNQKHRVWVGAPFYPYRLTNPRSSNPLRLYEDFYEPWKDRDVFSSIITRKRLNLRNTVIANARALNLSHQLETRLKAICDRIDTAFFYPVVYRVNINTINATRLIVSGSGLTGSQEYLIEALAEDEFELLFFDPEVESLSNDFANLRDGSYSSSGALSVLGNWLI